MKIITTRVFMIADVGKMSPPNGLLGFGLQGVSVEQIREMLDKYKVVLMRRKQ